MTIYADLVRGATAHNVVGVLPGRTDGSPIVIGGHHDCWFGAAFDDATGVAATLAIAKALVDAGYEPEHPTAARPTRPRSTAAPTRPSTG